MKIKNMISARGNKIANQFVLEYGLNCTAFQSYETLIAVYIHDTDTMYIDGERYSNTTSKYLNLFKKEYQPLHIQEVENEELHKIIERG